MKHFTNFFILIALCIFVLAGCNNKKTDNIIEKSEFYEEAMTILDEFNDDKRTTDFKKVYELLTSLPENIDGFVEQIHEVNFYFEKYGVEFKHGGYYLRPLDTIGVSQEMINKYRSKGCYYDVVNLAEKLIYPVLFEKYGYDAECVKGISANNILSAINGTNNYYQKSRNESYSGTTEIWEHKTLTSNPEYSITYHSNGLVNSISIPLTANHLPLNEELHKSFLDEFTNEKQKSFAGGRFKSFSDQIGNDFIGYEVLNQIYSKEELNILFNYIKSLSIEEIWERNLSFFDGDETAIITYSVAIAPLVYKGYSTSIHYGLGGIYLRLISSNYSNELSKRWYTILAGVVPREVNDFYIEYLYSIQQNDTNEFHSDYSYDLDSNAHKYILADKLTISFFDTVTFTGVIEPTTTNFPEYHLMLDTPIRVSFKEYENDEEFICNQLYFYTNADTNGKYDYASLSGKKCSVTATLEDYRGGVDLYLLEPTISIIE